jgi:beta-glucosidase
MAKSEVRIPSLKLTAHPDAFCRDLLHQMTLEEKVGQMVQADRNFIDGLPNGIRAGQIGSLLTIPDAKIFNEFQHIAVEETRLHIPLLLGNDIIHGYRTIFPIPLALASAWDLDLIDQIGRVMMAEAGAAGTTWNFAPMVDICRDPRWGRIAEGAGEDAWLGSQIAKAWVKSFQSAELPDGKRVTACVKHFAAYGGAESGKDYNTVDMSEQRLRNEYLPPYKAAVDAGVSTLMTSFNELNGVPATINAFLIQKILREEWGYDGVIISDYDAIGELLFHGVANDLKEATRLSVLAGIDIDMMGYGYHRHLADLVRAGEVSESIIDAAVLRILKLKVDLGVFDHPYVDETAVDGALMRPEYLALAEKAAGRSVVLLKNEGDLLPLRPSGKTIALIGPLAEERQSLLGCWYFDGRAGQTETLRESLQYSLPADTRLICEAGCSIDGEETDFSAAVAAARQADLVLLALGETDRMSGEAHCRANLHLPGCQQALVEAVCATGVPASAIICAGRPLVLTEVAGKVQAVLMAWHGGTKAAQGISNILLGRANPSARLTVSFPRSEGQVPVYYAHSNTGRPVHTSGTIQFNEAHRSAYLDESNDPLYPFGFGLSYSSFKYDHLTVHTPVISAGSALEVSVEVTNTGKRDGEETVQCYIRDLVGSITRPVKQLKGFQKIALKAGESRTVKFVIPAAEFSFYGMDEKSVLEPGKFDVWIGPNSDSGLGGSFELK